MPRKRQATEIPCRTTENTDQLLGIAKVNLAVRQSSVRIKIKHLPGFPLAHEPGLLVMDHR